MAHHQLPSYGPTHTAQSIVTECQNRANSRPSISEDETLAELDEPPDDLIHFARAPPFKSSSIANKHPIMSSVAPHARKASLLTQALLTSEDLTPNSDAEAPLLTSDADLTSPARTNSPSPPLPATRSSGPVSIPPHSLIASETRARPKNAIVTPVTEATESSPATDLEAGLGRKRCIKFACGRQAAPRPEALQANKTPSLNERGTEAKIPTKRPCMLKFVCPTKALTRPPENRQSSVDVSKNDQAETSSSAVGQPSTSDSQSWQHRDSVSTIRESPSTNQTRSSHAHYAQKPPVLNNLDLEGSEATRFHEFAGPYNGEDEWINEQTAYRKKITVNDTLQKENAIRKLGEEAEEEALEEEDAEEEEEQTYPELDEMIDGLSSDDALSDAGNETDDEEGFAASDNESELGSDYQFWTPGVTTAATSADHLEHIRPSAPRTASDSSIESMIRIKDGGTVAAPQARRVRKAPRTQPLKMRPGTPDLPDSTDFVCGTLDEDRPLEAAYMSCLEERRRSKRRIIPQDIDPSFPSSDLENDKDDRTNSTSMQASDEPLWVMGQPDNSDEEYAPFRRKPLSRRKTRSPMSSPKRLRSPPPQKRSVVHRSPPPPAVARPTTSTGSSSMSSSLSQGSLQPAQQKPCMSSPARRKVRELVIPNMSPRPRLRHTASLPRTPNPFWAPCHHGSRLTSAAASPKNKVPDMRSRGPIDIVMGLEKKRQRRKEKCCRQNCRNGAKDKERRCQPGEGAERMRELGLEMAGKSKSYLPTAQLMLSI
ncbi:MAG: hypothetical protein Q9166_008181 [cf. Caloplaca sp. 2 TL-2023]